MRDMDRLKESGKEITKKYIWYDMTADELSALFETATSGTGEDILDAILKAYYMGVAAGSRCECNRAYRARKKGQTAAV